MVVRHHDFWSPRIRWNGKGLFGRPPSRLHATIDRGYGNSCFFSPSRSGHSFSKCGNQVRGSSIISLLVPRGPLAVRWPMVRGALFAFTTRIVPIIVFSFYRMARRRPPAHITQKVGKRIEPSRAYPNASLAVIVKGWRVGIGAPILHLLPYVKLGFAAHAMFLHCTATAISATISQAVTIYDRRITAVTQALPVMMCWPNSGDVMQNEQFTESLAGQVKMWIADILLAGRKTVKINSRHWFSYLESALRGRLAHQRLCGLVCLRL